MPRQPMVLRVHFYHANGQQKQSLTSAVHHIDYMGSVEKHELLVDEDDHTSLESAAIHARYAGAREGSLGYFGTLTAGDAQAQIRGAAGPVWRVILSVGEADALAMGGTLTTKAGWSAAAQQAVPAMLRRLGLDPTHTEWIAAVHRHQKREKNPHIHLLFWERGPGRRTMAWSPDELHDIRRAWAKELYAPELQSLGQAKDAARGAVLISTRHLLDQVRLGQRGASAEQGVLRELRQRLTRLRAVLPDRGRLAYAYMPADVKAAVLDTARWLVAQDDTLRTAFSHYLDQSVAFNQVHWATPGSTEWGGPEQERKRQAQAQAVRQRAAADLLQRLAGPILRAAQASRQAPTASGSPHPGFGPSDATPYPRSTVSDGTSPQFVPTSAGAGALMRELQSVLKKAAWEARKTAYQLAEAQWRRQRAELAKARAMGMDIQL